MQDRYRRLISQLYPGAQLVAMARLIGGVSADVYRLDIQWPDGRAKPVVLREHRPSHSGHPVELEFQLLQALLAAGLPVPEVEHVDASGGLLPNPFLLMAFVEGSTDIPGGQELKYVDTMAATLASIHDTAFSGFPKLPARNDPLPEVLEFLPRNSEWEQLRTYLESLTNTAYQGPPNLLHGDFWPENVLWQNGSVSAILDWEDAAVGDPLSDVAGSRLELRYKLGDAGVQRYTQAYAKFHAIDLDRLALWQVYVAAAAQRYMGEWGLDPELEAHMRSEALASIREASLVLLNS